MKRIINGKLYDSTQAEFIVKVDALIGERLLLRTRNGNFFSIEKLMPELNEQLVPMTKDEAIDFMNIHKKDIPADKHEKIVRQVFGQKAPASNPLPRGAKEIARAGDIEILYISAGSLFYLEKEHQVKKIIPSAALAWVEDHQDEILNLETLIKNHFPSIERA